VIPAPTSSTFQEANFADSGLCHYCCDSGDGEPRTLVEELKIVEQPEVASYYCGA
jgi:hypothetical protein